MYSFDPAERRELGTTGLRVSGICLGSGGLGSLPQLFGYETPESQAIDTVLAGLDSPLNFYDTSAGYSDGESEKRIGKALACVGGLPAGWVLETKVDPVGGRFDGDAVRRPTAIARFRPAFDRRRSVRRERARRNRETSRARSIVPWDSRSLPQRPWTSPRPAGAR